MQGKSQPHQALDLHLILQNMADGITVQDAKGVLIYANLLAAQISGFRSVGEFLKTPTDKIVKKFSGRDQNNNPYNPENFPGRQVLRGKPYAEDLVCFVNPKNNQEHFVIIKATPIFDTQEKLLYIVNVFHDVTSEKTIEKNRDIFVAMASHELKSLLTSIHAYIELLQRHLDNLSEKNGGYLTRLSSQVTKLTGFISDLLDLSRMKAGRFSLDRESVDIQSFISDILTDLQVTTPQQLVLKGNISQNALLDKKRISEVIMNFITNAIKYAPQSKKIIITLKSLADSIEVSVTDFGRGIKKQDQKKVFELYSQTDQIPQTNEGLGIGLFIAKTIITAHGGIIGVNSTYGKGSTFYFRIPKK